MVVHPPRSSASTSRRRRLAAAVDPKGKFFLSENTARPADCLSLRSRSPRLVYASYCPLLADDNCCKRTILFYDACIVWTDFVYEVGGKGFKEKKKCSGQHRVIKKMVLGSRAAVAVHDACAWVSIFIF